MHYILSSHTDESIPLSAFYQMCIEWLKVSDVMLVLPNWETSKGTLKELELAGALNIPIYFLSPTDTGDLASILSAFTRRYFDPFRQDQRAQSI